MVTASVNAESAQRETLEENMIIYSFPLLFALF